MKKQIAIIGGGISGMSAAYYLKDNFDITIFEKSDRLGGHSRTKKSNDQNDVNIDTGFIVFNYQNYPLLTQIFEKLDVQVEKSNMSFSASFEDTGLEYSLQSLNTVFSQYKNIISPKFWKMIYDIFKFNRYARKNNIEKNWTLEELLNFLSLGEEFFNSYFLPLSGAIWSATPEQMRLFPAHTLIEFFKNHRLLASSGQLDWYTVTGGSINYVNKMENYLTDSGVKIYKNADTKVLSCHRGNPTIIYNDEMLEFDFVIMATHSDVSLSLIQNPTVEQKIGLTNIKYQPNEVILHSDESFMPENKKNWSAWNYKGPNNGKLENIPLTYWMNKLQNINTEKNYFVTLNPVREIKEEHIISKKIMSHPIFDFNSLAGQEIINENQGVNNIYFCGAYLGYGFHEDGVKSAFKVAETIKKLG